MCGHTVCCSVLCGMQRDVGGLGTRREGNHKRSRTGGEREGRRERRRRGARRTLVHRNGEGLCLCGAGCVGWAVSTPIPSPFACSVAARAGTGACAPSNVSAEATQERLRRGRGAKGMCAQLQAAPCSQPFERECGWLWCTRAAGAAHVATGKRERRDVRHGREAREPEARSSGRRRRRLKRQHGPEIHLRFWISSLGL